MYYEHSNEHPLQPIDASNANLLPQGWLFLAYSSRRNYAFYGIFKDYNIAKAYMENKEGYFGDWTTINTYERIIMFDPNHPVLYWGYDDTEPTYLVVWEYCSSLDRTVELLPGYDWVGHGQFDDSEQKIYDHIVDESIIYSDEDGYVDGIDEDTYMHMILVGRDKNDAIQRSVGIVFDEDISVDTIENIEVDEYMWNEKGHYDLPFSW